MNDIVRTLPPPTGYRYTSQRRDETLGLNDYNARYYDSGTGRFISADSIIPAYDIPQAYNRFAYVYNNPLLFTDPTGYFTEDAITGYLKNTYGNGWEEIYYQWKTNDAFWNMLLAAQAGDTLFGGVVSGFFAYGFFYTFLGEGDTLLTGIVLSGPMGGSPGELASNLPWWMRTLTLNDFATGRVDWGGFIRWEGGWPSFYVREGLEFTQRVNPDWLGTAVEGIVNTVVGAISTYITVEAWWARILSGLAGFTASSSVSGELSEQLNVSENIVVVVVGDYALVFQSGLGGWSVIQATYGPVVNYNGRNYWLYGDFWRGG